VRSQRREAAFYLAKSSNWCDVNAQKARDYNTKDSFSFLFTGVFLSVT
jgi:hypothetical protein